MNARRLIEIALERPLETSELHAACVSLGIDLPGLCDALSKEIAEGYLRGDIPWDDGDVAMNCLFAWAYGADDIGLSEFSMDVFLAFDQGEFRHDQRPESGPEFHTVPRLKHALATQMAQPYIPADALRRG
jgi:hypothetical protein